VLAQVRCRARKARNFKCIDLLDEIRAGQLVDLALEVGREASSERADDRLRADDSPADQRPLELVQRFLQRLPFPRPFGAPLGCWVLAEGNLAGHRPGGGLPLP
jgi:hypothetical protein